VESLYNAEFEASNARYLVAGDENTDEVDSLTEACEVLTGLQEDVQDCDCGGDYCPRGEYRYFNPSSNYVTPAGEPRPGESEANVVKYTLQDYERMESLNNGNWSYIGIRAEAEIVLPYQVNKGCVRGHEVYAYLTQTLGSGGLWGIESDSERSYFEEVKGEELSQLKGSLRTLGFSARAIATAFKSVEEVEE